jgi:hypothetical protein
VVTFNLMPIFYTYEYDHKQHFSLQGTSPEWASGDGIFLCCEYLYENESQWKDLMSARFKLVPVIHTETHIEVLNSFIIFKKWFSNNNRLYQWVNNETVK